MAAKKCLICNCSFSGRRDAKTCSARCRKRLQLVRTELQRSSFSHLPLTARHAFTMNHDPLSIENGKRITEKVLKTVNGKKKLAKGLAALCLVMLSTASLLWGSVPAQAATSNNLNFQARLLTSTGAVVPDGNYNIEFKIYDSASSGASAQGVCSLDSSTDDCWWLETRTGASVVRVVNGYMSVNLGSVTAFGSSIPWDQPLWLTMNIGGTGGSPSWDGEMLASGNRIKLTGVPYAFRAGVLAKNNGTQTGTLSFNTVANSPVITLPDASGTLCIQGSSSCGFINNSTSLQASANFNIQSAAAGSIGGIITGAASQSADIFQVKANGVSPALFSVGSGGVATFRNSTNSTAAFQVQNAGGASLVSVDSTNGGNITFLGNNSGETSSWQSTSSLAAARDGLVVVSGGGYAYALGGNTSSPTSTVQYAKINADGTLGTWTNQGSVMPAVRSTGGGAIANGYIYYVSGTSTSSTSNGQATVFYAKLNPDGSTGTWTSQSPSGFNGKVGPSVFTANGYLYMAGGRNTSGGYSQEVLYAKLNPDGTTGSWTTSSNNLVAGRAFGSAAAANGFAYFVGGFNTGTTFANVYRAQLNTDGTTGSWSATSSLNTARSGIGSTTVIQNGYIYAMGGDNGGALSSVEFAQLNADGSINSWTTSSNSLPAARSDGGVFTANGYVYYAGGANGGTQTNVYYTSTSRIKIGGSIDLVGLSGENLAQGNSGGELTAGNTNIIGNLGVIGLTSLQGGLAVNASLTVNGGAYFQNAANSTTAFQIQQAGSGSVIFTADTSNLVIRVSGNTTTFATLHLENARFKSTQTTAPTIGTPTNCGTTPTAAVGSGSTDIAGSFRITAGTGTPDATWTCDTVITFNKAYGAAPKSVILSAQTKDGGTGTAAARQIYVSGSATTTFTVKFSSQPAAASEVNWFYFWVVE